MYVHNRSIIMLIRRCWYKEFLDRKPLVSLFTRPRRFGKTLNMDMLRVFFEISEDDTSKYFTDKAIWKMWRKNIADIREKYPVIFLTFKDVKIRYVGSNHRQNPRITSGRIWEASRITEQWQDLSVWKRIFREDLRSSGKWCGAYVCTWAVI